MKKLTKLDLALQFLKENQGIKFPVLEVAKNIYAKNIEFFAEKRSKFSDDKSFFSQLRAEISYGNLTKSFGNVIKGEIDKSLNGYLIWYEENLEGKISNLTTVVSHTKREYSEHELYPILIEWLKSELDLYCLRIDEKKSRNANGRNGNKWLHPDIVAIKVLDQHWHKVVKDCVKASPNQRVELLSFEVKKEIGMSDVREYFFQTVSNSSWANEGYLVATSISDEAVKELRVLSSLHGIGVILLNPEQISESKILLPARHNFNVDWQSINRIVSENKDFQKYIEYIETYYSSNKIYAELWNK